MSEVTRLCGCRLVPANAKNSRKMDPSKLRHFRGPIARRGVIYATILSSIFTYFVVRATFRRMNLPLRQFHELYDPEKEWKSLLESGVLKTVDKDGNLVNLTD
ncbi:hypothetical protein PHET_04197 [Paragonimus heterotremus]|uniref:Mitochondrial cytochrome c oxidase subunit VIc/VIIs domain-containing protein n=1 Tax=Paragonimus heterotremus TaxID=100268 RepID=A0A8J4TCN3_9TREM|nr:hypothetical protein PHET_04197 [Paragonimus heterotremus]